MPRRPGIRYFESRKAYYCQMNGKQHQLAKSEIDDSPKGPNFCAACAAYARLCMTGSAKEGTVEGETMTLAEVVNCYLGHLKAAGDVTKFKKFMRIVGTCLVTCGSLPMAELKAYHIQKWLEGMSERWCDNTRVLGLKYVNRAINFAVKQGRLKENPIRNVEKPRETSRGEEAYLSMELRNLLVNATKGDYSIVLAIMKETGARPVEVEMAEAQNYIASLGALCYRWNAKEGYLWKNAKKQKKDRTIYLSPAMAAEVEKKIVVRPTGKLFLSRQGSPFVVTTRGVRWEGIMTKTAVAKHMASHGLKRENVLPYSFRHSFITDWLLTGRSIKVCADLCGTSVTEIERTYGHLTVDTQAMRRMYLSFHEGT